MPKAGNTSRGAVRGDRGGRPTRHQLRISLEHIRPPIWRRVVVPSSATLAELHQIIQVVMGWLDYHLHEFAIDGVRYVAPEQLEPGTLCATSGERERPPR